jgi:hypothetical protein
MERAADTTKQRRSMLRYLLRESTGKRLMREREKQNTNSHANSKRCLKMHSFENKNIDPHGGGEDIEEHD